MELVEGDVLLSSSDTMRMLGIFSSKVRPSMTHQQQLDNAGVRMICRRKKRVAVCSMTC